MYAPHVAKAVTYAEEVLSGEVVACRLTKLSCQRFIDELYAEGLPYEFDQHAVEHVCEYVERLPHIKGEWAKRREMLSLEPWQCFILANVFGWKHAADLFNEKGDCIARHADRRYKTAYIEVARKNAKSTLAAAIGLYMLDADDEEGAEVFSAATTRNQAKIVFDVAKSMAKRTQIPVQVWAHSITKTESASKFEALHAQGETLDGLNISAAICDEVHAWKSRAVYDVIETATGSRKQPLILCITTAGFDHSGIAYELRGYLVKILEKTIEDDSFFGMIYTLDDKDDWTDRDVWPKANPNLNVSVYPMDIESLARKAAEISSQQNGFLTKRLNVWCNAAEAWMNMIEWNKCESEFELDPNQPVYVGIDMASRIDVNSAAFVQKKDGHIYAELRHWLPEEAVRSSPNNVYDGWVRSGHMLTTPGNVIDVDRIEDEIKALSKTLPFAQIGVDPGHNSTQLGVHLAQEGFTVVDVRPTVLNFSDPMKWLEGWVKDGTFHHHCPILTWMVSNVVVRRDYKDNLYPRRESEHRKIDGVIALLIAFNRMLTDEAGYWPDEAGGMIVV